MRSIKTTSGSEIVLDGDLLAVLEALYHEVTARKELERSFEDMNREINFLIDQLTEHVRQRLVDSARLEVGEEVRGELGDAVGELVADHVVG